MSLLPQLRTLALALLVPALGACASGGVRPVDTASHSMVYGHIASGKPLQAVRIAKLGSPRKRYAVVYDNGDFFIPDVTPGRWMVYEFVSGGERYYVAGRDKEWNMQFIVDATPGSVHYLGAWRVTGVDRNVFSPDKFGFERTPGRGSAEVLQHMAPELEQTGWSRRLRGGGAPKSGRSAKAAR